MLVFFDDELTTFRNKNYRFICNVKNSCDFGSFDRINKQTNKQTSREYYFIYIDKRFRDFPLFPRLSDFVKMYQLLFFFNTSVYISFRTYIYPARSKGVSIKLKVKSKGKKGKKSFFNQQLGCRNCTPCLPSFPRVIASVKEL